MDDSIFPIAGELMSMFAPAACAAGSRASSRRYAIGVPESSARLLGSGDVRSEGCSGVSPHTFSMILSAAFSAAAAGK